MNFQATHQSAEKSPPQLFPLNLLGGGAAEGGARWARSEGAHLHDAGLRGLPALHRHELLHPPQLREPEPGLGARVRPGGLRSVSLGIFFREFHPLDMDLALFSPSGG